MITYSNKKRSRSFCEKEDSKPWWVNRGIGVSQGTEMNSGEMRWIGNLRGMKMNWERVIDVWVLRWEIYDILEICVGIVDG